MKAIEENSILTALKVGNIYKRFISKKRAKEMQNERNDAIEYEVSKKEENKAAPMGRSQSNKNIIPKKKVPSSSSSSSSPAPLSNIKVNSSTISSPSPPNGTSLNDDNDY